MNQDDIKGNVTLAARLRGQERKVRDSLETDLRTLALLIVAKGTEARITASVSAIADKDYNGDWHLKLTDQDLVMQLRYTTGHWSKGNLYSLTRPGTPAFLLEAAANSMEELTRVMVAKSMGLSERTRKIWRRVQTCLEAWSQADE